MWRAVRVLRRGSVVAPVREAHGTGARKPAEEWREESLYDWLGEHPPGEDDQDARYELEQRKEHPGHDCHGRIECGAGRYGCEEVRVEGGHMLGVPETRDYAEDDGYKGDGIFKAGAIINGRRVLVDKEETDYRHNQGCYKNIRLGDKSRAERKQRRTTPTAMSNPPLDLWHHEALQDPANYSENNAYRYVHKTVHPGVQPTARDGYHVYNEDSDPSRECRS